MSKRFVKILKNRNFLYLWTGQFISNVGDRFAWLAMIVLVYDITGKAANLGFLMIFLSLPSLIFGSFAGVFVDRWNRKMVMIISDILRGFLYISLSSVTIISQYLGINELYYVYLVAFLSAAVTQFFYPARTSTIPNIVDEEDLMTANSLSQTTLYISMVIGPSIGGLTIGLFGVNSAFLINGFSFFFSAFCIAYMKIKSIIREEKFEILKEWAEGFRICVKTKPILFTLILFSFVMLAGGAANVLLYPFAIEFLGADKIGYGFLVAMNGMGMIGGAIVLGKYLKDTKLGKIMLSGMCIGGFGLAMMGILKSFYISLFLSTFVGILNAFISVTSITLFQKSVEDKNRGKVFGITGMIITVFTILSMGAAGFLGDYFGSATVIAAVGVGIFSIGLFGKFIPGYEET